MLAVLRIHAHVVICSDGGLPNHLQKNLRSPKIAGFQLILWKQVTTHFMQTSNWKAAMLRLRHGKVTHIGLSEASRGLSAGNGTGVTKTLRSQDAFHDRWFQHRCGLAQIRALLSWFFDALIDRLVLGDW